MDYSRENLFGKYGGIDGILPILCDANKIYGPENEITENYTRNTISKVRKGDNLK